VPSGKQRDHISEQSVYFILVKRFAMTSPDILNSGPGAYSFAFYFADLMPKEGYSVAGILTTIVTRPDLLLRTLLAPGKAAYVATLLLPPLRDALSPDAAPMQNMAKVVADSVQPVLERLKSSRRDSELCRQILLTLRYLLPSSRPMRQRARLANRPFYQDAAWLAAIVARAEGLGPPVVMDATSVAESAEGAAPEEDLPPELLVDVDDHSSRGRRDRQRGRNPRPDTPASTSAPFSPAREPRVDVGAAWQPGPRVRTPIPSLEDLGFLPRPGPAFLGRGGFGGRWAARSD